MQFRMVKQIKRERIILHKLYILIVTQLIANTVIFWQYGTAIPSFHCVFKNNT